MKDILRRQKTYLALGCVGLIVLGLAAAEQFPYLETSPFSFTLPTYAAY